MGLLKSGFMQPVEDTTPIEESEETNPSGATLISDIPDDAFGHVLFWLPPLTNLAAARVAKQYAYLRFFWRYGTIQGDTPGRYARRRRACV